MYFFWQRDGTAFELHTYIHTYIHGSSQVFEAKQASVGLYILSGTLCILCKPGLPDFLCTTYQNVLNIPNDHKIYQMAIK
jgi:hypothetical protein